MKYTILIFYIFCELLFFTCFESKAETHLPIGSHEKLYKVMELPLEEYYNTSEGLHVDLGIKYTMYEFLGLPLYQQGNAIFIGYLDKDNYLLFSTDLVSTIATLNDIEDIQGLIKIPFWDRWGGRLVLFLLFIIFLFLVSLSRKKFIPVDPVSSSSLQ